MKPTIQYEDFEKLELRIGRIVAAEEPEWSRKLLQFTVDFGQEFGTKIILSGVRKWYTPADFLEKNFPFVINLAERKMGEGVSQGMMMMGDMEVDGEMKPIPLALSEELKPGALIR